MADQEGLGAIEVERSVEIDARAEAVWAIAGGFGDIAAWHPALAKCELEEKDGGVVRTLTTVDGGVLVERLRKHDDAAMRYEYAILESPLGVANYASSFRVDADREGARAVWRSRFDPPSAEAADAVTKAVEGIYEAGLGNLKAVAEAQ